MLGGETKKNIFYEKALPGAVSSDLTQTRSKKNQAKVLKEQHLGGGGTEVGCLLLSVLLGCPQAPNGAGPWGRAHRAYLCETHAPLALCGLLFAQWPAHISVLVQLCKALSCRGRCSLAFVYGTNDSHVGIFTT